MIIESVFEQVLKITESGEINFVPMQSAINPVRNKTTTGRSFHKTDMHFARLFFIL